VNASLKDGFDSWTFRVTGADGAAVKTWRGARGDPLPAALSWDGLSDAGQAVEGVFSGVLDAAYTKGNDVHAESAPFICVARAPELAVSLGAKAAMTDPAPSPVPPGYFSPDNDGENDELYIDLTAASLVPFASWRFSIFDPQKNPFWETTGKAAITPQIVWNGQANKTGKPELVQSAMDYGYEFAVTDTQGLSSLATGSIPVDVLVMRRGDDLYMQIPAIVFRADHADFAGKDVDPEKGLSPEVIANNQRVLRRVAEVLAKFRDYKVTVEGHANSTTGTEAEETSTDPLRRGGPANIPLLPLSADRAAFVKNELVKLGVAASRLTTEGIGGRRPVAPLSDTKNWWKNRRVEFILNK